MTWREFKSQVENLLQLQDGNSRIVFLGRPSALVSEEEERYVLKGERPFGNSWIKVPHWPHFDQLKLRDFTAVERNEFIPKYLSFLNPNLSSAWNSQRSAAV